MSCSKFSYKVLHSVSHRTVVCREELVSLANIQSSLSPIVQSSPEMNLKTGSMVLLIILFCEFQHCVALGSTLEYVINKITEIFSSDEEHIKDLTAAEEVIRGLTFDQFKETYSSNVMGEITLSDFPEFVQDMSMHFAIPDDIKYILMKGRYAAENLEHLQEFSFQKGQPGTFVYGRVATVRHGKKIDIAYTIYDLQYKLPPAVIEHSRKQTFLWFVTKTNQVWRETKERNLSLKESDYMAAYFLQKAIDGFKRQYPKKRKMTDEL